MGIWFDFGSTSLGSENGRCSTKSTLYCHAVSFLFLCHLLIGEWFLFGSKLSVMLPRHSTLVFISSDCHWTFSTTFVNWLPSAVMVMISTFAVTKFFGDCFLQQIRKHKNQWKRRLLSTVSHILFVGSEPRHPLWHSHPLIRPRPVSRYSLMSTATWSQQRQTNSISKVSQCFLCALHSYSDSL